MAAGFLPWLVFNTYVNVYLLGLCRKSIAFRYCCNLTLCITH